MTYFIAEVPGNGSVRNESLWKPTRARTLAAAKRAAKRDQMFQGTSIFVATQDSDGKFVVVAQRAADPINMNRTGQWKDC